MADDVANEYAEACHLCRCHGYSKAAAVLAREWAREIRRGKTRRKKGVWVKLATGARAFLDRDAVEGAIERGLTGDE
jgi:hypothetical protein